jgi:hypothetical protein
MKKKKTRGRNFHFPRVTRPLSVRELDYDAASMKRKKIHISEQTDPA